MSRYDNSEDNPLNPSKPAKRVFFGNGSTDEMCFGIFQLIVDKPSDERKLQERPVHHAPARLEHRRSRRRSSDPHSRRSRQALRRWPRSVQSALRPWPRRKSPSFQGRIEIRVRVARQVSAVGPPQQMVAVFSKAGCQLVADAGPGLHPSRCAIPRIHTIRKSFLKSSVGRKLEPTWLASVTPAVHFVRRRLAVNGSGARGRARSSGAMTLG